MVYASSALAILWVAFWVYWLVSAVTAKKSIRDAGNLWRQGIFRLIIIALLIIIFKVPRLRLFFLHERLFAPNPIVPVIGLLLSALGLAFAVWARVHLGRNWGMPMTMRENPEFVTSGPYGLVRHPIYTGFLLAIIGTSLVAGSIWILVFVICMAYFVSSAVTEEKLMTRRFPDQYSDYKNRTKMFVPFLC
jgi:protein-S-isoprenylcysteine O-methyltransferase Ste14